MLAFWGLQQSWNPKIEWQRQIEAFKKYQPAIIEAQNLSSTTAKTIIYFCTTATQ